LALIWEHGGALLPGEPHAAVSVNGVPDVAHHMHMAPLGAASPAQAVTDEGTPDHGAWHAADRWRDGMTHWLLMTVAMMAPVTLPAVRFVALNSLRTRRWRAMLGFLAGFIGVWAALGVLVLLMEQLVWSAPLMGQGLPIPPSVAHPLWILGTLLLAAGWQVSRGKRRALNDCTRVIPLRPLGWRADASCGKLGLLHGWRCARSCWALMLAASVAGGASVAWMFGVTLLVLAEELSPFGRRLLRPSAVGLVLLAVAVLIVS
jgi:predicted metal-binding membrane protein